MHRRKRSQVSGPILPPRFSWGFSVWHFFLLPKSTSFWWDSSWYQHRIEKISQISMYTVPDFWCKLIRIYELFLSLSSKFTMQSWLCVSIWDVSSLPVTSEGFLRPRKMHQTRWSLPTPVQLGRFPGLRPYLPKRSKLSTQIRTSGKVGISPVFLCWCVLVYFQGFEKQVVSAFFLKRKKKSSNNVLGYKYQNTGK